VYLDNQLLFNTTSIESIIYDGSVIMYGDQPVYNASLIDYVNSTTLLHIYYTIYQETITQTIYSTSTVTQTTTVTETLYSTETVTETIATTITGDNTNATIMAAKPRFNLFWLLPIAIVLLVVIAAVSSRNRRRF